jgi:hypothetical protein
LCLGGHAKICLGAGTTKSRSELVCGMNSEHTHLTAFMMYNVSVSWSARDSIAKVKPDEHKGTQLAADVHM